MQTIETVKDQSWLDIAASKYGNVDAIGELIAINPHLITLADQEIDLSLPIPTGSQIFIDETSPLYRREVVEALKGKEYATADIGDFGGVVPAVPISDADATAFVNAIAAEGIVLSAPQQAAILRLVLDLKGYFNASYNTFNIWSKFAALWPFIGAAANAHKYNLKDARNLDAAFRLVFVGSPTHTSDGIPWNGTSQYARTFLTPTLVSATNNAHMSYYCNTSGIAAGTGALDMGVRGVPNLTTYEMYIKFSDGNSYGSLGAAGLPGGINLHPGGMYITTSRGGVTKHTKNGIAFSAIAPANQPLPARELYIGCINHDTTGASFFTNRRCAFASAGTGLTDDEAMSFYRAVQTYQTALGRQA